MRCIFSIGELELLLQKVVTNLGCALQDKEQADEDLDAILAELDGKPASAQASSTADAAAPAAAEDASAAQAAEDADNTAVSLQSLTPWCAACLPEAICKLRYMPVPLKQLDAADFPGLLWASPLASILCYLSCPLEKIVVVPLVDKSLDN